MDINSMSREDLKANFSKKQAFNFSSSELLELEIFNSHFLQDEHLLDIYSSACKTSQVFFSDGYNQNVKDVALEVFLEKIENATKSDSLLEKINAEFSIQSFEKFYILNSVESIKIKRMENFLDYQAVLSALNDTINPLQSQRIDSNVSLFSKETLTSFKEPLLAEHENKQLFDVRQNNLHSIGKKLEKNFAIEEWNSSKERDALQAEIDASSRKLDYLIEISQGNNDDLKTYIEAEENTAKLNISKIDNSIKEAETKLSKVSKSKGNEKNKNEIQKTITNLKKTKAYHSQKMNASLLKEEYYKDNPFSSVKNQLLVGVINNKKKLLDKQQFTQREINKSLSQSNDMKFDKLQVMVHNLALQKKYP